MTFPTFHVAAAVLTALLSTAAAEYYGDGTFYGNNGWAGACAGNVPNEPGGQWPPRGASYTTGMNPGSSTPINVALNSAQYSTSMCGKLLYVKATGQNAGCTTCGTTPIPAQYMLARVTNDCPTCSYGDLDFGMNGDGRWKIQWYWAASGASTYSVGSAARATIPKKAPAPKVHHHTPAYWAKLYAIQKRLAAKRAAAKKAAAKKGRKLLAAQPAAQQLRGRS